MYKFYYIAFKFINLKLNIIKILDYIKYFNKNFYNILRYIFLKLLNNISNILVLI